MKSFTSKKIEPIKVNDIIFNVLPLPASIFMQSTIQISDPNLTEGEKNAKMMLFLVSKLDEFVISENAKITEQGLSAVDLIEVVSYALKGGDDTKQTS